MRAALFTVLSISMSFASGIAFADGPQMGAVAQQVVAVNDSNRIVCHFITHEGMLIRTTECHSQREWNQIRRDAERQIDDFQQRSLTLHR